MKHLTVDQIIDIKLQEWGRVDLKGIGTIRLLHDNALVNWTDKTIRPPEAIIVFTDSKVPEAPFSLHNHLLLSGLNLDFEDFAEKFSQQMEQTGEYFIPNIGRFSTLDNGKLHFDQDPYSSHTQAFSLKATYPFVLSDKNFNGSAQTEIHENIKSRSNNSKLLLRVGLVLALLLLLFVVYNQYGLNKLNKSLVNIPEDRVNVKPESLVLSDIYIPDILDSIDKLEFDLPDKEEDIISGQEMIIESDKDQQIVDTDYCLIIVGAFSIESNALRMTNLLKSMGYDAMTSEGKRLTRVGAKVSCADYDSMLMRIRIEVEPNAWLLDK